MFDAMKAITDRIIAELEKGRIPWQKPWSVTGAGCISYSTGKPYSVLNTLLLGGLSGEWITFNQASRAGGHVKKGEKGSMVVFWKQVKVRDKDTDEEKIVPFLKSYTVFHAATQCEGIAPRWAVSVPQIRTSDLKPDARAEQIVQDYISRSGVGFLAAESSEAYYSPALDRIVVPELSQFSNVEEYYSTVMHECTHSTGHASRLNRFGMSDADYPAGKQKYSLEELVAELGAAFLVNHAGLETEKCFRNSAAYISSWLTVLKNDKRAVVMAAGRAEKAVNLILGQNDAPEPVEGGEKDGE